MTFGAVFSRGVATPAKTCRRVSRAAMAKDDAAFVDRRTMVKMAFLAPTLAAAAAHAIEEDDLLKKIAKGATSNPSPGGGTNDPDLVGPQGLNKSDEATVQRFKQEVQSGNPPENFGNPVK